MWGVSGQDERLVDEWRVWNGARGAAEVREWMRRVVTPREATVAAFGDPTAVEGDAGGVVSQANADFAAVVLAVYRWGGGEGGCVSGGGLRRGSDRVSW